MGQTPGRIAAAVLLLVAVAFGIRALCADEQSPDAKAKAIYAKYLKEHRENTWGAFQRRLRALRQLGQVRCERAWKHLLKVAKSGKTLDDRILAVQGVAGHGDVEAVRQLVAVLKARGHPVLTEIAGQALAKSVDGDVLAWLREDAFALPDAALPCVLRAHARLGAPEAAATLAARYPGWVEKKACFDLAFDAVRALGRSKATEGGGVLLQASVHHDVRLRLAAADVLAGIAMDDVEGKAAAALRLLLEDEDARVKRAMAEGIGAAKAEVFVPNLTHLLRDEDPRTAKAALDVLKAMTGKDLGFDGSAWRRWWKNRDTPAAPEPYTVATYHGLPIFSERIVFILDRSGSMRWPFAPGQPTRMEVTRKEMVKVLGEMPAKARFNVIAFDSKVSPWRKRGVQADEKTVAKAARWVEKQESKKGAGTNTYGVLKNTLELNPEIDTIYFLSDGIPENGEITTSEGLLAAVADWNRFRRVKIHAIALTLELLHPGKYPITRSMRRAAAYMKDLARAGGGRYKIVQRP